MPTLRLTNRSVQGLPAGSKIYIAYDDALSGFGCRVTPRGVKSWVVEFRRRRKRSSKERVTIGRVGVVLADQARTAAQRILARVRLGEDVIAEFLEQKRAKTVRELAEEYLRAEIKPLRKATTYALYRSYLNVHVLPALGTKSAIDVTYRDVSQLHRRIGERTPTSANRVIAFLSGLYSWAAKVGEVPHGIQPTKGVEFFREKSREYFLNVTELNRLERSLVLAETVGIPWTVDETKANSKHAPKPENRRQRFSTSETNAIRLLVYTGCRLREILHLKWSEVDFERSMLVLGDSKTGRRRIFLSDIALQIIRSLPKVGDYVIAGQRPDRPRADLKRPWRAISQHARLSNVRIHDLRHTFASYALSQGAALPVIGKLLGHRNLETTQRYAHLSDHPLFRAANITGDAIAAALSGANTREI